MAENNQTPESGAKSSGALGNYFSVIVIILSFVVGFILYQFVLGAGSNFKDGVNTNEPLPGNFLAIMYKGGFLVPGAIGLMLMLITFSVERIITLARAAGKASLDKFIQTIQIKLQNNDLDGALADCDVQQGTVGNVVREAIIAYKKAEKDNTKDKDQKIYSIQKALEESTALEIPLLEKHLVIIATIVSIATLVGLIGTVLGMIRAFAALATQGGAPDATALATGISEALVNTALGITTSTIATVAYNYFTASIDETTYRLDEAGFSIVQTFAEKH
jgi:biopolymer transport protein ExbB